MNFITVTESTGPVVIDVYNIAVVRTINTQTTIELYKGQDVIVTEAVADIEALITQARNAAIV